MSELSTKVITGKVRFSFVNVFEPKAFGENQTPKYSVMLLIPKSDVGTLDRMRKAIEAAAEKGKATKFGGKIPTVLKSTLKDADVDTNQDGDVFADLWDYAKNHYILNVSSKVAPQIVETQLLVQLISTVVVMVEQVLISLHITIMEIKVFLLVLVIFKN